MPQIKSDQIWLSVGILRSILALNCLKTRLSYQSFHDINPSTYSFIPFFLQSNCMDCTPARNCKLKAHYPISGVKSGVSLCTAISQLGRNT